MSQKERKSKNEEDSTVNSTPMLQKILLQMQELVDMVKVGFETQLCALQSEMFEMRKELDREREAFKRVDKDYKLLKQEVIYLEDEVNYLRQKIDDQEQEERNNDVILDNLPQTDVSNAIYSPFHTESRGP